MNLTKRQKTHPDFPGYIFYNTGEIVSLSRRMKPCLIKSRGHEYYQYRVRDKDMGLHQFYSTTIQRKFFPYDWIELLEEDEETKELKDYPGYYITTKGRVWSMKHYKFLTPMNRKQKGNLSGYTWKVVLGLGVSNPVVHTLVGRTFLPEYREGLLICHKEETLPYPEINYLDNLWVGTYRDNSMDLWEKKRNGHPRYTKQQTDNPTT